MGNYWKLMRWIGKKAAKSMEESYSLFEWRQVGKLWMYKVDVPCICMNSEMNVIQDTHNWQVKHSSLLYNRVILTDIHYFSLIIAYKLDDDFMQAVELSHTLWSIPSSWSSHITISTIQIIRCNIYTRLFRLPFFLKIWWTIDRTQSIINHLKTKYSW